MGQQTVPLHATTIIFKFHTSRCPFYIFFPFSAILPVCLLPSLCPCICFSVSVSLFLFHCLPHLYSVHYSVNHTFFWSSLRLAFVFFRPNFKTPVTYIDYLLHVTHTHTQSHTRARTPRNVKDWIYSHTHAHMPVHNSHERSMSQIILRLGNIITKQCYRLAGG